MIFRRTLFSALLVGLFAGLVFSLIQYLNISPIIFEAETFEVDSAHDHNSHSHSLDPLTGLPVQEWAPAEGVERASFSIFANVVAGIGYASILLGLMSLLQQQGLVQLNIQKGLAWGIAGFITFFLAPSLGLAPEIPGIKAENVEHRQIWWLMCVCCVGAGLLVLGLAPLKAKLLGLALLASPYIMTIPNGEGPLFVHPDAETVLILTSLHHQFIVASGLGNLVFWQIIGVTSAWFLSAWILKGDSSAHCANREDDDGVLGA